MAIHRSHPPPAMSLPGGTRLGVQPGTNRGIEGSGINSLQHPADSGLIRPLEPPREGITTDSQGGQ